ncbi:MAG: alpha/beta hydrolase [Propionibacteriaceae bacterium]
MSLTGSPLLVVLAVVAVGLPVGLAVRWRRTPAGGSGRRRAGATALRAVAILVCQAVAVLATGVALNRSFVFYNSWSDLLGRQQTGQMAAVSAGTLVPTDGSQGRVVALTVHGKVSGVTEEVLVWLPPQYGQRAFRKTNFPVLMALPGQPGTPAGIFKVFDFARNAMAAIDRHSVSPFVAVFPPLSIAAPRDTECTDVPRGPQADSWLATDVREGVARHFRVTPNHWSTMGWSTGGFCAAKMLLRHPTSFDAAVSIGGYYGAEEDHTTGTLFNHSQVLKHQNSPLWLLQHSIAYPVHLLIVTSKADRDSWSGVFYADAKKMVAIAVGVPGVDTILLPAGGHSFKTYLPTVAPSLDWLGKNAGL